MSSFEETTMDEGMDVADNTDMEVSMPSFPAVSAVDANVSFIELYQSHRSNSFRYFLLNLRGVLFTNILLRYSFFHRVELLSTAKFVALPTACRLCERSGTTS
jgi:hypothetical protein